ncbi:MAG: hypothetical protein R3F65_29315 [bacterium]
MNRLLAVLTLLLAHPAAAEPEARYELQVVAVHRPLDLEGRFTTGPREVYLQPIGEPTGPLDALVGETLVVVRTAPVPAVVPITAAPAAPAEPEPAPPITPPPEPLDAPPPPTAAPRDPDAAPRVPTADAPGATSPEARVAAPAAPAPVAPAPLAVTPLVVVPQAPAPAEPPPPAPAPVPTHPIEVPVARLEVTAIRGPIVVARVLADGVAPSADPTTAAVLDPPAAGVDLPAVLAGDIARYVHRPPVPPPPPLTAEEKARLDAERGELERDDHRRRNQPGPYERPVMKWKL